MSGQTTEMMADPWGARARDWAAIEDEGSRTLFENVLDLAGIGDATRLLDVGCGSGLGCEIAASRGAIVAGLDTSPGLLEIAKERAPRADFRVGDMVSLPWGNDEFDVVTFINTFFFAPDQLTTLREAKRVTRPGGQILVISWSSPERVQATAYLAGLEPLLPPMPMEVDPFIAPTELKRLANDVGLQPEKVVDLEWVWDYPDLKTALRGWLSVGLSAVAIGVAGEEAVRNALKAALAPFVTSDGGYRLENLVHCLVAKA